MLVDSSTTSTVHHNLLFFINGVTTFSTWQIVLSWNRVEVYAWDLNKDISASDIEI